MNLADIRWNRFKELQSDWQGMKINCAAADHVFQELPDSIGCDPGRNLGIATIFHGQLTTYWATLPAQEKDFEYFGYVQRFILDWFPKKNPAKVAIIEGPSYASLYRQPMLEDIRLALLMSFRMLGKDVDYVAPQSVRKIVFGHGRTKAADVWYDLNGKAANGADAAAVALFAAGYCNE